MGGTSWIYERIALWVVLVLSLTVHEYAHAAMADSLGDDTARLQGRATLNPFAHLDLVGTVLLPLLGVPFGWAKPVPVEPLRFREETSMMGGLMQTALAGPVSNLLLAGIASAALTWLGDGLSWQAHALLERAVQVNIALCLFNLLPFPPMDGSRVVEGLMPDALRPAWEALGRVGPVVLVVVIGFLYVTFRLLFG